ncbi:MAG TPA: MerR family transcriptional regulator [Longimicrobiales bacterium]|nr:MerR family transcriptional regulator [Longimicrobiales bacterium]
MSDDADGLEAPRGPLHPIGVVAKRTGITLHVLRAWERRYAVVEPVRTSGGQRLYTDAHIERLRLLRRVTEAGRNISQVAALSDAELAGLAAADEQAPVEGPSPEGASNAASYRSASLAAGERLDGDAVYGALMRALVSLRPGEFLGEVLLPLLRDVGERWNAGRLGPAQEHVVSVAVRRVLTWLLDAYEPAPDAPVLVLTTVSGEQHEFGAMVVGAVALEEGWRVVYLGASLPPEEIARAATMLNAPVVGVSMVNRNVTDAVAGVEALRRLMPASVRVLAGGAGAHVRAESLRAAGAEVLTELQDVRASLRAHRLAVAS